MSWRTLVQILFFVEGITAPKTIPQTQIQPNKKLCIRILLKIMFSTESEKNLSRIHLTLCSTKPYISQQLYWELTKRRNNFVNFQILNFWSVYLFFRAHRANWWQMLTNVTIDVTFNNSFSLIDIFTWYGDFATLGSLSTNIWCPIYIQVANFVT